MGAVVLQLCRHTHRANTPTHTHTYTGGRKLSLSMLSASTRVYKHTHTHSPLKHVFYYKYKYSILVERMKIIMNNLMWVYWTTSRAWRVYIHSPTHTLRSTPVLYELYEIRINC